jgi:hypothetical protein
MKRLYPDMPDVTPTEANRAIRIVERHLRTHRVSRACDLPEEARIRLYRDLRLFFDGNRQYPQSGSDKQGFSLRGFFSRLWEKLEDFLSACDGGRLPEPGMLVDRPTWERARMRA